MTAYSQIRTASVTLPAASADTADNAIMTFAVGSTLPISLTLMPDWAQALANYVNALRTVGATRGYQGDMLVKIYNPLTGLPNYPIYEESFALSGTFGVDMPLEVALCVSYANTTENSIRRARRRGRHYVPGHVETGNLNGRPTTALVEAVADAYADYLGDPFDGTTPPDPVDPCVYSRTEGEGYNITRAYVDNEWDIQRRRGSKPTSRYYPTGWGP